MPFWSHGKLEKICGKPGELKRGPGILLAESRKSTKKSQKTIKNIEDVAGNRKMPFWSHGKLEETGNRCERGGNTFGGKPEKRYKSPGKPENSFFVAENRKETRYYPPSCNIETNCFHHIRGRDNEKQPKLGETTLSKDALGPGPRFSLKMHENAMS